MKRLTLPKLNPALRAMLLYGLGLGVMKGISLLMLPWLTHALPPAEFGRLELILSIVVFASVVAGLGMQDTMCRFIGEAATQTEKRVLAAEFYGLALVTAAAILPMLILLAWQLSQQMPQLLTFYELSLVLSLLAFESCINLPLTWMRMQGQPKHFFFATTGRAVLNALLILLFTAEGRGVAGVIEAGFISAVLQLLWLSEQQLKMTGIRLSKRLLHPMLSYGLPLIGTGLMAFTLNGLDRWVLQYFTDTEQLAIFAVATKFALGLVLLQQPFTLWWFPRRFDVLFNRSDADAARYTTLGLGSLCILGISLSALVPLLIQILLPESYQEAASIASVLILAAVFKEMGELLNFGCLSKGSSKTNFYINAAAAVVGTLLMSLLTPQLGMYGIALALCVTQLLRALTLLTIGQQMRHIPYSYSAISLMLLICITTMAATTFKADLMLSLLAGVAGCLCVLAILLYSGCLIFKAKGWRIA